MNEKQEGMFEDVNPDEIISHLGNISDDIAEKWPPLVVEIIDLIRTVRESQGANEEEANMQALEITQHICKTLGGVQVYLPRGKKLEAAIRNNKIWLEFTGNNIDHLMHKYDMSQVRIYQIISEQRKLHIKKVQTELFTDH